MISGALVGSPSSAAADRVGARKNCMHSIYRRRCAVALVHVTATNPFCARRHADLVGTAIIADHGTGGVRAMEEIVARLRRIRPARSPPPE